ncbi:MAG TPA: TIGR00153 family protein [Chromatiaceae bacterium]|nr:TIGR00153 family protein [Chromatiaceae bacterium]HIB83705.1 TIGR00153 family protein [Chromatiaceae bacterium]HIN83048.1 TIGR00153 family protein [Chromatiales bacterium]HIO14188.1 TIGR00153 family protein [Chromatiales bacterium]HIO55116.1 TIGR00153 family protein [Chromatiales bacterium]
MARTTISSLFGNSPVTPLQNHMSKVHDCVKNITPFFESALAENWTEAKEHYTHIAKLERKADKLKKDLRLHLPNSLFMPVPRRDLLEVLTMQDTIANRAKDIAGLVLSRKMIFPDTMGEKLLEFTNRCVDASAQAKRAIHELDELVETGFRGVEVTVVENMIRDLDKIEGDTDKKQKQLKKYLFKREADLPPVDVMFMYKVIEWVGNLADRAQKVGSRLQLLLAR